MARSENLSRGAAELSALVGRSGNALGWADKLGVTNKTVYAYMSGARRPSPAMRLKIHEHGGPEPEAWDELQPQRKVTQPRIDLDDDFEPLQASPEATRELADQLTQRAHQMMRAVDELENTGERVRALEKLASVVKSLGALTGAAVMNDRQVRRSPVWKQIESAILRALESHPDALNAVLAELATLESDE